jgi:hypothetical protein
MLLLLSEGRAGKAWEPAYKVSIFLFHPQIILISPPIYFYIIYQFFTSLSLSLSQYIHIYTFIYLFISLQRVSFLSAVASFLSFLYRAA